MPESLFGKKLRTTPIVKLLIVFAVAFSLASITGPMSSNFRLPSVPLAHANVQRCDVTIGLYCNEYWVPAGAAEDTFQATIFTDESSEFTNIQTSSPSIDLTDWPLTPDLTGPFTTSPNFLITSTISAAGNFEVEFMLAANFWGVSMNFGNSTAGINVRQGIWHVLDTAKFASAEPALAGQAVALDSPNPSDNVGGLLPVNPCNWDSAFPETFSNCSNPPAGGLAYHLGTAAGAGGFVWNQAPGSADLNAAAQHFVTAGIATGFNPTTSVLTGISSAALSNPVNFFIRNDNTPRLDLGNSMAEQICYLFTGAYTVPCGYLTVTRGPITAFPGFTTSTTAVNLSWGMYTAAFGSVAGPLPFDSTFYFIYNSQFVSGIPAIKSPTGPCSASSVPTVSAPDYMYVCDPVYDSLTNQMEFASSLSSALSFGAQAETRFGNHAYTIEVFQQNEQFGYQNNGWIRADNNAGSGLPNFWTWLNAWNPSPVVPGTLRQGFKQTTSSVSPFIDSTVWDAYIVGNIYDSLAVTNPTSGGQLIYWMALSVNQLPNSGLTYTPPGPSCSVDPTKCTTQTFRFTLRSDMFFQDGRKVTSFDVAFSYLSLMAAGAYQSAGLAPITGITILSSSQLDINLSSVGPFTLNSLTSPTVMPGRYWTNAGAASWDAGVTTCTTIGAACYPAQYTLTTRAGPVACTYTCTFPATNMNPNPSQISGSYDPIAAGVLIGSGPWECKGSNGLGSGCVSIACPPGPCPNSYTLTRFGKGVAPASSISSIYFRSGGNLALWTWSLDTGDATHDFLNYSIIAICFGTTSPNCSHWMMGIGGCGGTLTSPCTIGLQQVAIVNRFVGLNWVAPYNWQSSPPAGIIPFAPVIHEGGYTLNQASTVGCTSPFPSGGYD